jgi:hypothetical protein
MFNPVFSFVFPNSKWYQVSELMRYSLFQKFQNRVAHSVVRTQVAAWTVENERHHANPICKLDL